MAAGALHKAAMVPDRHQTTRTAGQPPSCYQSHCRWPEHQPTHKPGLAADDLLFLGRAIVYTQGPDADNLFLPCPTERARSISPQKSSPANTPPPSARRKDDSSHAAESPALASSPTPDLSVAQLHRTTPSPSADPMDLSSDRAVSPLKEARNPLELDLSKSNTDHTSPPRSAGLSRTPTLSWQRRPQSQGPSGLRSRPLSMFAAENAAVRSSTPPTEVSSPERAPSRDQISQALAGKDPSWFRQTADRGASSAAYRKNQVEDADTVDVMSARAHLPGMSRPASTGPEERASRPRPKSMISPSSSSLVLPTADVLKLGPPADIQSGQDGSISGRTSPSRPASPTKGMGGFVQSAMMKRTDSVKRWSVTTPGLQRGNTVANRTSYDNKSGGDSPGRETISRPSSRSRDSVSRPTSSHAKDASTFPAVTLPEQDTPATPAQKSTKLEPDVEEQIPTSPSKTMDPRRWSPTKSSWLDAALKRPESPKPKPSTTPSNQPAWMVELNRAKAEKAKNPSVDIGRPAAPVRKHEVKTGGLSRPAPMGTTVKSMSPSIGVVSTPTMATEKPVTPVLRSTGFAPSVSPPNQRTSPPNRPTMPSLRTTGLTAPNAANELKSAVQEGSERRVSLSDPLSAKPEAEPKMDFRSGLRSRGTTLGNADKTEPVNELASVFGTLRKTKTQNYKAPDEFKDNILRGKAGLNVTGGPRPYEKKDEFKDAILKKKADFKQAKEEGRGVAPNTKTPKDEVLPEGLARARASTLSRIGTLSRDTSATKSFIGSSASETFAPPSSKSSEGETTAKVVRAEPAPSLGSSSEKAAPERVPGKIGGSTLANRFNPALAGLLARGPPGMGGPPSKSSGAPGVSSTGSEPSPGPQLTHMTKNRARGPRRKAPPSTGKSPAAATGASGSVDTQATTPDKEESNAKKFEETKPPSPPPAAVQEPVQQPVDLSKPSPTSLVASPDEATLHAATNEEPRSAGVISLADSSRKAAEPESASAGTKIALVNSPRPSSSPRVDSPKPSSLPRSPPRSPPRLHEQIAAIAAKTQSAEDRRGDVAPSPITPRKLDMKRMSKFLDEGSQSPPKGEKAPSRSPSPNKRATIGLGLSTSSIRPETERIESPVSVKQVSAMFGRALTPTPKSENKTVPAPLMLRPRSTEPGSSSLSSPSRSPSKTAADVSIMLKKFFGPERPKREYRVDTAEVLMNRPKEGATVQTQKYQLFQITEQGKKVPVPAHHERVLFEREMYICSHTFTNEARKTVQEVYFWIGDEVSPAAVEDAQVFVNREAKAMGGDLVKIPQGKETAEFIHALGGILIIRRGSNNKYDSLASNMLCGRQYMRQVVFDEVDFTPTTLCSGFPYVISQSGKCYIWKGKGTGINELSCARLIGMDLALMGELIEVEEGNEPENFWDLFGGSKKMSSADHWRLKPTYDKYCGRLFCSEAAGPKQVRDYQSFVSPDMSMTDD